LIPFGVDPLVLRVDFIQNIQKFFPFLYWFSKAVFHIAEALLIHSATSPVLEKEGADFSVPSFL